MSILSCGLLGLPNVGKSTLFNALAGEKMAAAENYPFCTIEPNKARIAVPDKRLEKLASLAGSANIIPALTEIVDIAGLVKGASKGEGLGNQFLGHVREVDALIQVVRCFEDEQITHVNGCVSPVDDIETIETELMLADLESLEKRLPALQKKMRFGGSKDLDPDTSKLLSVMENALALLQEDKKPEYALFAADEQPLLKQMGLLTSKPVLYVLNVEEENALSGNRFTAAFQKTFPERNCLILSVALESEMIGLAAEEQAILLADAGIQETGIKRLAGASYALLNLQTFFTVGPKEARAWSCVKGTKAPDAGGLIHTDLKRGFIAAEVLSFDDYVRAGSESEAQKAGKVRREGKEYIVQDGDVLHIRFNV